MANRAQRRAAERKGKIISGRINDRIARAAKKVHEAADAMENAPNIRDGDRVKLDIERIMGRFDYAQMSELYRAFVESNKDTVFTARAHRQREDGFSAIFSLAEAPEWLFWYGDLKRIEDGG